MDSGAIRTETPQPVILRGHKGKIVDLAFSHDGKTLASASWDGSIGIWPLADAAGDVSYPSRFIRVMRSVNAVQFSDDDAFLYSAGRMDRFVIGVSNRRIFEKSGS